MDVNSFAAVSDVVQLAQSRFPQSAGPGAEAPPSGSHNQANANLFSAHQKPPAEATDSALDMLNRLDDFNQNQQNIKEKLESNGKEYKPVTFNEVWGVHKADL